jgi:Asp-tRNA(Asn)/Glu-tRNA(Gln) amidotransferase A subunit family amidase
MASNGLAMSWSEWVRHDGVALAALVRSGQLTAREVVGQAAAGIAKLNPKLNAVLEVFEDVVADPARDGPNRAGRLYGVPIFLKDLGSRLKGRKQEVGTALMKGNVSKETDPLVENFLAAGLVPLGRSTTPEFGMTFDTSTIYLGAPRVTRNPWNLERTPGGSSGGSAASVAAGVTPISMASDGGGSTRIPASYCGLVGLKASRGRIAMPLAHSEYTWRIAVEGVVTRSVRDSAAVLDDLTRKPNGGSFYPMAPFAGSYAEIVARPPARLRIALSTGAWGRGGECDRQVAEKVRGLARVLEGLRHDVVELDDRKFCDWEAMWSGYLTQWICGRVLYSSVAELGGIKVEDMKSVLSPMVYRHFDAAQRYTTFDLLKAMSCNNVVTRGFGKVMDSWDVLLCPTHAIRVPQANGPYSLLRDEPLETWLGRMADACRYTMPGNEAGLPGISVPVGRDSDGLPVGAMLYGNFGREDLLLQLAAEIEATKPEWFGQMPPVHVGMQVD